MPESVSLEIGGRTLTSRPASLLSKPTAASLVRYGDANVVLAAVTASEQPRSKASISFR